MKPIGLSELLQNILVLNNPDNPYTVVQKDNNLVATWNIVDAKWYQMFAKAGMKKTYEMTLSFDEKKHEVAYVDRTGDVKWEAGLPQVSFEVSKTKGKQLFNVSGGRSYGVKDDLSVGEIYKYDFDVRKIKDPIFKVIEDSGWKVKKSFFEKLFSK